MPCCLTVCLFGRYLVRVTVLGSRLFLVWNCVRGLTLEYPVYFLMDALWIVCMYGSMCLWVSYIFLFCMLWGGCDGGTVPVQPYGVLSLGGTCVVRVQLRVYCASCSWC